MEHYDSINDIPDGSYIGFGQVWMLLAGETDEKWAGLKRDIRAYFDGEPPADAGPAWLLYAVRHGRLDIVRILCARGVRPSETAVRSFLQQASHSRALLEATHEMLHDAVERFGNAYRVAWRNEALSTSGGDCEVFDKVFPYIGSIIFDARDTRGVPLAACATLNAYGMQFDMAAAIAITRDRANKHARDYSEAELESLAMLRERYPGCI